MRAICAAVLATTMMISSAAQAEAPEMGPLSAGKPAGIQQAQIETGGVLLVLGILVVAGGIAALASTTQGNSNVTPTTTNP